MTDSRDTPSNGRVAHTSLEGKVEAERFVDGETVYVRLIHADLLSEPGGARERQLLRGDAFRALDLVDGYAFGFAERDGYCGWVSSSALDASRDMPAPTHRVSARQTYAKRSPRLKDTDPPVFLSHNAQLVVAGQEDGWARVTWSVDSDDARDLFVPADHLSPLDRHDPDPVAVARLYLGTPYLWGGNSAFGLDCSGLVQAAMRACGVPCPGDSDQQQTRLGEPLPDDADPQRGDLYFWKGHVGIVSDPETLLHATAHYMAVVEEPLTDAIQRIRENEGLEVAARRRVTPPRG